MIETYGMEEHIFAGTGKFNESHLSKPEDYPSDDEVLDAGYLMSETHDITILKLLRYLDVTEISSLICIYYVVNGSFNISVNNKSITMEKGNTLLIPPYTMQKAFIDNDDSIVFMLLIKESSLINNFHNIMESQNKCSDFFIKMLNNRKHAMFSFFQSPADKDIKNSLLKIFIQQNEKTHYRNLMIKNQAENFFILLFSRYEESMTNYSCNAKNSELVYNILNYVYKNYSTVTLDDIAKKYSYSSSHISRILYQDLGKKYNEIITEIRLNKAQELLTNTNLSIEDICQHLGYSNTGHLRYLFSKAFNISPSQYRKQYSKK